MQYLKYLSKVRWLVKILSTFLGMKYWILEWFLLDRRKMPPTQRDVAQMKIKSTNTLDEGGCFYLDGLNECPCPWFEQNLEQIEIVEFFRPWLRIATTMTNRLKLLTIVINLFHITQIAFHFQSIIFIIQCKHLHFH